MWRPGPGWSRSSGSDEGMGAWGRVAAAVAGVGGGLGVPEAD